MNSMTIQVIQNRDNSARNKTTVFHKDMLENLFSVENLK